MSSIKKRRKIMTEGSMDFRQTLLFAFTGVLLVIYLLWRLLFTLPLEDGLLQLIFGILLLTAEGVTIMTTFELYYRKMKEGSGRLDQPVIPKSEYPDVDVFIATHNEPCDVLYKTCSACTYMEYPDRSKVHIYLCDDSCRPEVRALAEKLGVGYLGAEDNRHAKSGNLNHALSQTHSPLIATFDADMIPRSTFLMDTVPYFLLPDYIRENDIWRRRTPQERDDKLKIGLIQTPQSFYNLDLFQLNLFAENVIPNEQDFFSMEVNRMRNSSNSCAYTGSNTLILRKGLEEIGGFPYHTITEDFETSCRLQMAGYITYATDKIGAHGLSTTDVASMMKQRIRWGRGVIQSIQNTHAIFSHKLPLGSRITYLTVFLYWWSFFNRLIFILAPILFALFDFRVVNCSLMQLLVFWLPAYFFYSLSMKRLSSNVRSQKWSQIIDTTFAPALVLPVFLETIHIREKKFKVTDKKKQKASSRALRYMLPHLFLILLSVLAILRFVHGKYGMALVYSAVIIYWLCYNLIALLYSVAFMIGRDMPRQAERIEAHEDVCVRIWTGGEIRGKTVNLSDTGVQICTREPLPEDVALVELEIQSKNYRAVLDAKPVSRWQEQKDTGEETVYFTSFTVNPQEEHDRREFVQLIYDRDTGIVRQLDSWDTTFDDLMRILRSRWNNRSHRHAGKGK